MGQKIHPTGFRLSVSRDWSSRWYAGNKNYATMLNEDIEVRKFLRKRLKNASVGRVLIERPAKNARITIYSARPGVVIGKKGEDIEKLKVELNKMLGVPVHVNIEEIRKPETDAQLIADSITQQLEKRIMFRRAMKRAMQNAMRLGALGMKIMSSGRLNGAEIARTEWYREGRVPLHTLRADVDYGFSEAQHDLRDHRRQVLGLQGRYAGPQRRPAGSGRREGGATGARRSPRPPRPAWASRRSGRRARRPAARCRAGPGRRGRGSRPGPGQRRQVGGPEDHGQARAQGCR